MGKKGWLGSLKVRFLPVTEKKGQRIAGTKDISEEPIVMKHSTSQLHKEGNEARGACVYFKKGHVAIDLMSQGKGS